MTTIKLIGAPQSPYSRKMRSALRYKRIPFQWVRTGTPEAAGHPKTKIPGMIPVLWLSHENKEQDTAMLDSTFQLKHL
jgi:glutathione S-transferase